ncbi:MAG: HAD family hydrolase [Planctomycetota bacterium]
MSDPIQALKDLQPTKKFFIGIDSDGCAFDTMEPKHKECFCPNFVKYFKLAAVSRYTREAWDFVNLYSRTRGCNRFLAVVDVLKLLEERAEVKARGIAIPKAPQLAAWLKRETKLGNPALKAEVEKTKDPELTNLLAWSIAVNHMVDEIVGDGVPPFPFVRDSLEKALPQADMLVVSQTPTAALEREWANQGIAKFVRKIAGQELGTKTEHLTFAAKGKYAPEKILMIGDAWGDRKAAAANGALFYPILPGAEVPCWDRFFHEALDRFFAGTYQGAYEAALIKDLEKALPELPPWR